MATWFPSLVCVQDAALIDPMDNKRKQWSEANVSEIFDLALTAFPRIYLEMGDSFRLESLREAQSIETVGPSQAVEVFGGCQIANLQKLPFMITS